MNGPKWTRLAAATGLGFAIAIAAGAIVTESKDIAFYGDVVNASNEVYGSVLMLTGVGAVLFFWFTGTLAARLRQLDTGSGRLPAVVNGSGAFIAAGLVLGVGAVFGARNGAGTDLAGLATALLNGPTLLFPAAAYVTATGLVGLRTEGLPGYSKLLAQLSVPLGAAYVAMAGLQIFKYYAWINDTAYITFLVWVAWLSIVGIQRWGGIDEPLGRPARAVAAPAVTASTVEIDDEPAPRPRKPAARKTTTARKKPAPRKR